MFTRRIADYPYLRRRIGFLEIGGHSLVGSVVRDRAVGNAVPMQIVSCASTNRSLSSSKR